MEKVVEGYLVYEDIQHPELGQVSLPVYSFSELKTLMDDYTSNTERYKNVRWSPNPTVLKTFMGDN